MVIELVNPDTLATEFHVCNNGTRVIIVCAIAEQWLLMSPEHISQRSERSLQNVLSIFQPRALTAFPAVLDEGIVGAFQMLRYWLYSKHEIALPTQTLAIAINAVLTKPNLRPNDLYSHHYLAYWYDFFSMVALPEEYSDTFYGRSEITTGLSASDVTVLKDLAEKFVSSILHVLPAGAAAAYQFECDLVRDMQQFEA